MAARNAASSRPRSALASRRADFSSGALPGAAIPPMRRKRGSAFVIVAGREPLPGPPDRSKLLVLRAASVPLSASSPLPMLAPWYNGQGVRDKIMSAPDVANVSCFFCHPVEHDNPMPYLAANNGIDRQPPSARNALSRIEPSLLGLTGRV